MKRFLGIAVAMFFAVVAIALTGAESSAVAGHGCHGRARCHGRVHRCERRERCHGRRHRCHGEAVAAECGACESMECGSCSDCVSGGCAGGDCSGEGVIMEGTPTEAAPAAPASPEAPAAPAKT
jgi:hypothetical protein